MADVAGVGRDHPLSMEKLSPILAFYVVDGLSECARLSQQVLGYGGMGHTAGIHTRSREAAVKFGSEMPASRITVNTPTKHGAIGFSTALPPSMTLGCGSWGGNVTSDNVSPLHLMDIKRVAFETRPVKSARPAVGVQPVTTASAPARASEPAIAGGKIDRQEIAAIVDRFLAGKRVEAPAAPSPLPKPEVEEVEAGSMYTAPAPPPVVTEPVPKPKPPASTNGNKPAVDFVSEDDVRRAIQKGEKLYINAKTIITPAARDLGEPAEVFAKV
jgi:acetaldehyde dehydrogenase (acetylating)